MPSSGPRQFSNASPRSYLGQSPMKDINGKILYTKIKVIADDYIFLDDSSKHPNIGSFGMHLLPTSPTG